MMKSFLRDFSGAFGDVGIMIPLALGMIIVCGLSPTSVFLPAGLLYLTAGWYYKIPFPVQPLKAVAAISLVNALRPELIATSAYLISAVMLLFLLFDFSRYLDRIFSKPIVRGIQFGLGMLLINSGIRLMAKGEIITGVSLPDIQFGGFFWGSQAVSPFLPSMDDITTAFVLLVIPQIPLTLGNSMVATADLAKDYFGEKAKRVTYRNLAGTIGAGNLLAGILGGMPVCHGCGGLTAHYRFGARTARSNFIIGTVFLAIALLFAQVSPYFLRKIPLFLFGIALIFVGVFHALLARDMKEKKDVVLVLLMGLVTLFYRNLTVALSAGLLFREALRYRVYYQRLCNLSLLIFSKQQNPATHSSHGPRGPMGGSPSRRLLDRYNRPITHLRVAVTDRHHINPLYRTPKRVLHNGPPINLLSNAEIYRLSRIARALGIEKIRITGGEPLLREGIVELIENLSSLSDLDELSLTTDGILLSSYALPLWRAGLQRVGITLDTLKEEKFTAISGGRKLSGVIRGIDKARELGYKVTVNVVVLKGINDHELEDFIRFSTKYQLTVRFIEYIPVVLNSRQRHYFISRSEMIEKMSPLINSRVSPYGRANYPSKYLSLNRGGETGVISPVSHGLCHNCNRLKITAAGCLLSCIVQDVQVDLAAPLKRSTADGPIAALFKQAVLLKPEQGICTLRDETIRSNR